MSAPLVEPSACTWCGIARRGHGRQYADAVGWHAWEQPSQEQILARMKARRLQLAVARVGALPVAVGTVPPLGLQGRPRTVLDRARDALGARMTKDDLRLVLENVVTYATGLEEALAAERVPYRERAARETSPARRAAWLRLAAAEESEAVRQRLLVAEEDPRDAEGDGITRRIAPTQTLRDGDTAAEAPLFVYRAEHPDSGITLGTYSTREAACKHCETVARRKGSTGLVAWVPDNGDALSPEELTFFDVEYCDGDDVPSQTCTGYVVTPLEIASEYDEEADE